MLNKMYATKPPAEFYYRLDVYFKSLLDSSLKYPRLVPVFKHYIEIFKHLVHDFIDSYSLEKELEDKKMNRQKYQRDILLNGKDFFKMVWYIPKAMEIIQSNNIKPNFWSIGSLYVDKSELDFDYLKVAINNKKPAIIVTYEAFQYEAPEFLNFIIDGSHRAAAKELQAQKNGLENPIIKAYQLNSIQTMECMLHDVHRMFYKMHCNINKLNYLTKQGINIESDEVIGNLYEI